MPPRTASPLLAVLLVTSSSRGTSLSFRYPRRPALEKRYSKVRYHIAAAGDEQRHASAPPLQPQAQGGNAGRDADVGMQDDEMAEEYDDAGSTLSEDLDVAASESSSSSEDNDGAGALDEDASDIDGNGGGVASSRRDELEMAASSSAGGTAATRDAIATSAAVAHARKRQRAYQQYLGYDCELLASLLAPKRELCHQKFELVIDDLAFVGHPVCVDKDGRWDPQGTVAASLITPTTAGAADRGRDTTRRGAEEVVSAPTTAPPPPMTLFHFVLVLDRPDPSPDLPALDLTSWLQIFYDNIAFKMTAALYAEEVRCAYVSRECDKIGLLRERCMDDGQSYASFLTHAIHVSPLARSLQQVHSSISLSSNAFVTINESIDAHLQLPPMLRDPARMMKMADVETPIDVNDAIFNGGGTAHGIDAEQVMYEQWNRTTGPFLLPWKTLLLLHDQQRHRGDEGEDDGASEASDMPGPGDKGIEAWARKFTSLLKPTLDGTPTLADVADLLDWSLHDDVFPMVRHLIYYREARVVDVPRIQNYYAVSPSFDLRDLAKLSTSWSIRFPSLVPLPLFLATLSSALQPFSAQLIRRGDPRQLCLDALIWLLRHQVVVQMHVRLRLAADEGCKRRAAQARDQERLRIKRKRAAVQQSKAAAVADDLEAAAAAAAARQRRAASPKKEEVVSALSATRPDVGPPQPPPAMSTSASSVVASGLAMTPTTTTSLSSANHSDELRFERRAVLRSRSPSSRTTLAMSVGGGSGSTRGSGTTQSRSGTPRGRGRTAVATTTTAKGKETDLAAIKSQTVDDNGSAGEGLTGSQAAATAAAAASLARASSANRGRSPSRARMRVTGFGDDEEVHLEREAGAAQEGGGGGGGDSDGASHVIKPSWAASSPSATSSSLSAAYTELKGISLRDEARRLSLVGEEEQDSGEVVRPIESTPVVPLESEQTTADKGQRQDDDLDDDDVYIDYDIEEELWETQPTGSIIAEPSRGSGDENEWIAAMVEGRDVWLVERLYKLLPFLNGKHTVDEIVYRLEWRRKELRAVLAAFRENIVTLVHP